MINHLAISALFPSRLFLIQTFLLLMFALPFAQSNATPVTFDFTGTITYAMYEHVESGEPSQVHSEWLGKPITGSVSIDLEGAVKENNHNNREEIYFSEHSQSVSAADWVKFRLVTPNGTEWSLPGSVPPNAVYYSYLMMGLVQPYDDSSYFTVAHTLETSLFPSLAFSIDIAADGEEAGLMLNSLSLEEMIVQPQFANIRSYGSFVYYVAPNDTRSYTFSIDSFTRATNHVPEPNSLLLAMMGAAGLLLSRRRHA